MRLSAMRGGGYDIDEVKAMVANNDKQRYHIKEVDGKLYIRANQGHSIATVDPHMLMTPITDASKYGVVLHGTYHKWWGAIKKDGLR